MPPARILTSYYRPKPGGLCKRLFRTIEALLDRGHPVHYLAVVPFPIRHDNCFFHRFPWPEAWTDTLLFWAVFHMASPLYLLTIGLRCRVSHAFAFGTRYALFLQPLHLLKHITLSLLLQADAIENHRIAARPGWIIQLERHLEGFAIHQTRPYGVSETLTGRVVKRHSFLGPARSGTLRNDIDGAPASAAAPVDHPLRLGVVGVLEPRKNQDIVLTSPRNLDGGRCYLYIYGDGPDRLRLEARIAKLDIGRKVSLMGWQESAGIWNSLDLLLPSLHEGAPNAILEALAHGIPVLSSDIPENAEILPPDTLLPTSAPEPWTDHLHEILADPRTRLAAIRERQRPYAERLRFDWNAAITGLITDQEDGH